MGLEPLRAEAKRTLGRGPQRATGAPSEGVASCTSTIVEPPDRTSNHEADIPLSNPSNDLELGLAARVQNSVALHSFAWIWTGLLRQRR